jgi:hypothetical protein
VAFRFGCRSQIPVRTAGVEELTRAENNGKWTIVPTGHSLFVSDLLKVLERNNRATVESMTGTVKSYFRGKGSIRG